MIKVLEASIFDEDFATHVAEIVESEPVQIVLPTQEDESMAVEHIKVISDRLFKRSAEVVEGSLHFADLDPRTMDLMAGPPDAWVLEIGQEAANKRFRLAKAAWLASKDAPMGIKLASDFMAAEVKARAAEKQAPRSLNVAFVQLSAPMPNFPRRIVDQPEDEK